MADGCCKFHDRLDLKLHQLEYNGAECGSTKFVHEFPKDMGGIPQANDEGQPKHELEYCCNKCPTLKVDIAAGKL